MGTNRRYGPPSEREERYRAAREEREQHARARRGRHCWVAPRATHGIPLPGVLIEWARAGESGQWIGRVVYVDLDGTVIDGWRYATELRPAKTEGKAAG